MGRYVVTDPPVAVPEFDPAEAISSTPPNIIYIRAKMDMQTDAKVKNELMRLGSDNATMEVHIGDNQLALLIHNILRWEGPDLDALPCTPASIRALDPTEPHIVRVLNEIALRNKRPDGPSKKSAAGSTSASAGAAGSSVSSVAAAADDARASRPLVTGISRSPLQSVITGRLSRSDDSTPTS